MRGMVAEMQLSLVAQHPARMKLYETVQKAVVTSLGKDFQRIALVGSTALQIDTPASDIDVIVFTRGGVPGIDALRRVAAALAVQNDTLRLELIDHARVPVLVVWTADGQVSLDLVVDQLLSELHINWLLRQEEFSSIKTKCLSFPIVRDLGQHFETKVLQCVKCWLRFRQIPTTKEGGYPTIVWVLMAIHSMRCSVDSQADHGNRDGSNLMLIEALAAFFERFASHSGRSGTISFSMNQRSHFHQCFQRQERCMDNTEQDRSSLWPAFSVIDPTAATIRSDLVPFISSATHLLYATELRRAQRFSANALQSARMEISDMERSGRHDRQGAQAFHELFSDVMCGRNKLPSTAPPGESLGAVLLRDGRLYLGMLRRILPRKGWDAAFLHRRDTKSSLWVCLCNVDSPSGAVSYDTTEDVEVRYAPCDFVCLIPMSAAQGFGEWALQPHDLQGWREMSDILAEAQVAIAPQPSKRQAHRRRRSAIDNANGSRI